MLQIGFVGEGVFSKPFLLPFLVFKEFKSLAPRRTRK